MRSTLRHLPRTKGTQKTPAGGDAAGARRGHGKDQPKSACRLSAEERRGLLVQQIAYSRAEEHGIVAGEDWPDWLARPKRR